VVYIAGSVEASENVPSTPTKLASSADFDKLFAAVGCLLLTDILKPRPGPKLGITGKRMEGEFTGAYNKRAAKMVR